MDEFQEILSIDRHDSTALEAEFRTVLKELLRKGVVKKNQDVQHELTDPFFGMWVMRRW